MYCNNCGKQIKDGAATCSHCGVSVSGSGQSGCITTSCPKCGANMEYDKDGKILKCPYCGHEEIIEKSDSVKVEEIRSSTNIELEKLRRSHEMELEKLKKEHEAKMAKDRFANEAKSIAKNIGGALVSRLIIIAVGALIALIGAGLLIFAVSQLIGNNTDMALYLGIAGLVVLIIGISVIRTKK